MITRPAAFRCFGEPAPKGSLKPVTRGKRTFLVEDNSRTKPWRRRIEQVAPVYMTEQAGEHQPVVISCLFAVTRSSAAHAREYPTTLAAQSIGGDLDKLIRCLLDSLEACKILRNDAQVMAIGGPPSIDGMLSGKPRKVYVDHPDWGRQWPGVYCRIDPVMPVGYQPIELPYEAERTGD